MELFFQALTSLQNIERGNLLKPLDLNEVALSSSIAVQITFYCNYVFVQRNLSSLYSNF